jgi:chromosome condensin MukBEF complex kleisin-like MukF subunit
MKYASTADFAETCASEKHLKERAFTYLFCAVSKVFKTFSTRVRLCAKNATPVKDNVKNLIGRSSWMRVVEKLCGMAWRDVGA